jgi:hypothetical protein
MESNYFNAEHSQTGHVLKVRSKLATAAAAAALVLNWQQQQQRRRTHDG